MTTTTTRDRGDRYGLMELAQISVYRYRYCVASFPRFNGDRFRGPASQCGPGLRYSVDLRIQTYAEPVPLKRGKLAAENIRGYINIFTVCRHNLHRRRRRDENV